MTDKNADISLIRELASILAETDLTEIEIAEGEKRVKVKREVTVAAAPVTYAAAPAAAPAAAAPAAAAPAASSGPSADAVPSPMVGTAYLAAKPGDPHFVKVGDTVKEGQTILIIEAMKVMNPIKSPRSGTVTEIMVTDAQPIEFGQPLVKIS